MLGLIGGGIMGEAIIKGLLKAKKIKAKEFFVSDVRKERLSYLEKTYKIKATKDNTELVRACSTIILAVKPQDVQKVLEEVKLAITPNHLLISIAAGIKTHFLESCLSKEVPVIRVMPNTPAIALAGMSVLTKGKYADDKHLKIAVSLFEAMGEAIKVPEKWMDVVTALSGSGPAYIAVFIEALADGGVKMGLPRDIALKLSLQTVFGTAKLLKETGWHPAHLKDMVSSPGGTTIAALYVIEKHGLRATLMEAIEAATERARSLND